MSEDPFCHTLAQIYSEKRTCQNTYLTLLYMFRATNVHVCNNNSPWILSNLCVNYILSLTPGPGLV